MDGPLVLCVTRVCDSSRDSKSCVLANTGVTGRLATGVCRHSGAISRDLRFSMLRSGTPFVKRTESYPTQLRETPTYLEADVSGVFVQSILKCTFGGHYTNERTTNSSRRELCKRKSYGCKSYSYLLLLQNLRMTTCKTLHGYDLTLVGIILPELGNLRIVALMLLIFLHYI